MTFIWCVLVLEAFAFLMLIRNELVHIIRSKAINNISKAHLRQISRHNTYTSCNKILNNPSYNKMMFMISNWTYKSFYGDLETRITTIQEANHVEVSD